MSRPKLLIGFLAVVGVILGTSASASGALPVYNGTQIFPIIHGPSDPEEYGWEVHLFPGERLEQIDDQSAAVDYENGSQAFLITAEPAHDATGATVPTTLSVSGENVVTLTVHHRAGNPSAGDAPFVYPISAGEGYEVGFSTVTVVMPPSEILPPPEACRVPKLTGRRLMAARWWLREAGCRMGHVRRLKGAVTSKPEAPRVIGQNPQPGVTLPLGTPIQVTLAIDPLR